MSFDDANKKPTVEQSQEDMKKSFKNNGSIKSSAKVIERYNQPPVEDYDETD